MTNLTTFQNRLTGLDFVRALACFMVVFTHLFQKLNYGALEGGWRFAYDVAIMGSGGVGIFFLLSGFLLSRPFWLAFDGKDKLPSLKTYVARRAARIVPGYYLSLIVSFVLTVTVFAWPLNAETWTRFLVGFTFLGALYPVTFFPVEFNQPLWSISMEVISYALLPLAFWAVFALRRWFGGWKGRLLFVVVIALAISGHVWIRTHVPTIWDGRGWDKNAVGGAKEWMPTFNPIGFFVFFAIGALAAGLSMLWTRGRSAVADTLAVLGFVVALLAYWPPQLWPQVEAYGWFNLQYAFPWFHLGMALALMALPHSRMLGALLDNPPVRFLAKISFGIYIWHMLALELTRALIDGQFKYGGISDTGHWLLLIAIVLAATLVVATLSWYVVEKPVLDRVGRRAKDDARQW